MANDINLTSTDGKEGLPSGEPSAKVGGEAGEQKATAPVEPAKTYSEDDWKGRQGAWDKATAEKAKQSKSEVDQLKEQIKKHETQTQQAEYTQLLRKVEEAGGDADLVGITKAIVEQARDLAQRRTDFETELTTHGEQWEAKQEILKFASATELVGKYGLTTEDRQKLLVAESAEAMEVQAAQMKIAKLESGQQPGDTVDSGAGHGPVVDVNKMSAAEQIAFGYKQLREKNK